MRICFDASRARAREIDPARAPLVPPYSKSDALRALVLAHATGDARLRAFLSTADAVPHDVRVLERGLEALAGQSGEDRDSDGGGNGSGEGGPSGEPVVIDCADGGAPFRFLLAQAAVAPRAWVRFVGAERLGERPHAPLIAALRSALEPAGAQIRTDAPWPIDVRGPAGLGALREPHFVVAGHVSSQHVSSLLLAAAALQRRLGRPSRVTVEGPIASAGYVAMTVRWLEAAGYHIQTESNGFTVDGYTPCVDAPEVPGDWSSLGYLLFIAWATGSSIARVDLDAGHPDRAVVDVARSLGLSLATRGGGRYDVVGELAGSLHLSCAPHPDLVPTLAAVACVLDAPSTFSDIAVLRAKESDRVEGIRSLVAAAGGTTAVHGSTLVVTPRARSSGPAPDLHVDAHADHRRAMSAATLAVLTRSRLFLDDARCVDKSFPAFWAELEKIGAVFSLDGSAGAGPRTPLR